jgi:hypothetical protein
MLSKRTSKQARAVAPRHTRAQQSREWPEWIDHLRRKVQAESPAKQAWAEKAGNVVSELMDLSEASLTKAASTPDNWTAVLRAMSSPEILKRLQAADPLAEAFVRGIESKRRLIKENGGVFSTERVAEFLGITPQAVNKRRNSRKLLGLTFRRRGYMYPAWQFDPKRGTVPGLEDILLALADHDEWMQNIFFVTPNTRLSDRRPLELLREGNITSVIEAAKSFGEHGAA